MAAKPIRKKDKKGQYKSEENPWAYQHNLQLLSEADKLTKDELLSLTCRDKYCIKTVMFENPRDWDDELYRIFGDMVGQTVEFMRHWLRVHVLTHKHQIAKFAKDYLDSKGLDISTWLTRPKTGKRVDLLALFLLCKIMKSHCFVHLKDSQYWTSSEETPVDHDTLLQKCNLHLAYLGCGNYAQLLLRTITYEYEIFGVSSPLNVDVVDMKLLIIDSLTADEESTLSQLLNMGLQKPNVAQTQKKVSASARSESRYGTVRNAPHNSKAIKLMVEPLVKVKRMSKEDILMAKQRVKDECFKSVSAVKAGSRSDQIKQSRRSDIPKKKGQFDVVLHKLQRKTT